MNTVKTLRHSDGFTRRAFAANLARTALGVSIANTANAANAQNGNEALADSCILLMMSGGMSHLDSFDPKPENTEVMGSTGTVNSATGEPFGESIPELASLADKLAIVRNMYQSTGDHQQASYLARTGYSKRPSIIHPSLGPWAQRLLGKRNKSLPDSVIIASGSGHPGRGFLPPDFSPLPIRDPERGVANMTPFGNNSDWSRARYEEALKRRLELMNDLDQTFRAKVPHEKVQAYTQYYDETLKFLKSEDLKIFDLDNESESVRDRYGRNRFGQGCLLAKRLVKGGTRFVEVGFSGWDNHVDLFEEFPVKAANLDQGASNLLRDLEAEGMLRRTIVAIVTEFGRTPKINANSGRDHHALAYSCVLAGGGIQGGRIVGKSDSQGLRSEDGKTEPKDFNATIAHAMGLDREEIVYSPSGRPFQVANKDGAPMMELFG